MAASPEKVGRSRSTGDSSRIFRAKTRRSRHPANEAQFTAGRNKVVHLFKKLLNWIGVHILPIGVIVALLATVAYYASLGLRWSQLSDPKPKIDVLEGAVHLAAVIIGGAWVLHRYVLFREAAWNIQLSHAHTIEKLPNDKLLLCVDICLKNIGKVALKLPCNEECLTISFGAVDAPNSHGDAMDPLDETNPKKKVTIIPTGNIGYRTEEDEDSDLPLWEDNDPLKLNWINVLRHYSNYYLLEPGVEYHEREYVAVTKNTLVYTRVFLAYDDTIRDSKLVFVDDEHVTPPGK